MACCENRAHIRTSVDLNKPDSKVLVQDEIEAYDFEFRPRPLPHIKLRDRSKVAVYHNVLHPLSDVVLVQVFEILFVILV